MHPGQLVSLAEPINILRESFRNYQSTMMFTHGTPIKQLNVLQENRAYDYDCRQYFQQLLDEIMRNGGNPEVVGNTAPSTDILIQHGMDRESAMQLALELFESTVDILAVFVPEASFGDFKGFDIAFVTLHDVAIFPSATSNLCKGRQ